MGPTSKNVKTHDTLAESLKILHANEDGANQKQRGTTGRLLDVSITSKQ